MEQVKVNNVLSFIKYVFMLHLTFPNSQTVPGCLNGSSCASSQYIRKNFFVTFTFFPSSSNSISTSLSIRGRSPASTCTSAIVLSPLLPPKSLDLQSSRFTFGGFISQL